MVIKKERKSLTIFEIRDINELSLANCGTFLL